MKAELIGRSDGERWDEVSQRTGYCLQHGWEVRGKGRSVIVEVSKHNSQYHPRAYGYLMCRKWTDPEPENLYVDLKVDEDLEPFVVFTTSSSWMNKEQVTEIRDFLNECLAEMEKIDSGK